MRTYGWLDHAGGKWHLDVEPHVAVRLKRLFAQIDQARTGVLSIKDTPDSSRDIEWFIDRYPLEMTDTVRKRLTDRAAQQREQASLVERLLNGMVKPQKFDLAIPPRDYQRVAAHLFLNSDGYLLADDLGVGKTVSAICGLTDPNTRPALVVTMTHLTRQWEAELARFAPNLKTHILKKGRPYDLTKRPRARKRQLRLIDSDEERFPDVIISNYHKLAGWSDTLAPFVRSVVFDEVQELRHGTGTNKGRAANRLAGAASFRLGMSATPIYNLGGEIHNVMEVIRPDALGTRAEFLREWCGGYEDKNGRASIREPKAFGLHMREAGLMLRRTKEEVGRELPRVIKIPHHVDCDMEPLREIQGSAQRLAQVILQATESKRGDKMQASQELDAMVRHATGVAKAPYVAEFVRMLADQGEKVLLYGWHHSCYDIWMERLSELTPVLYTGKQSIPQKEAAKKAFIEGDSQVLIMSLRAGAGLDGLQRVCRTVVNGELDWSPGVHEQGTGRVYRDEQKREVLVYYLVADQGSDPSIQDALQLKREQVEGIKSPKRELIENLEVDGERIKNLARRYLSKSSPRDRARKPLSETLSSDSIVNP